MPERTSHGLLGVVLVMVMVTGCALRLDGAPCPCAEGSECCPGANVCVAAGSTCPGSDSDPADAAPSCNGDGCVQIEAITPAPPYSINMPIAILGTNFDHSGGCLRIELDGAPVITTTQGWDPEADSRAEIRIPALSNVPPGGKDVMLEVSNCHSSDSQMIRVFPQYAAGSVGIEWTGSEPEIPAAGQSFRATFRIHSHASGATDLVFRPYIEPLGWAPALQILDADDQLITSMSVEEGGEATFSLRLPSVPAAPAGTAFAVAVDARGSNVSGASGLVTFAVGEPAPSPADLSMRFSAVDTWDATADARLVDGYRLIVDASAFQVTSSLGLPRPGTYRHEVEVIPATAGWSARPHPQDPPFWVITETQPLPSSALFRVVVTKDLPDAGVADLVVRVREEATGRARELRLRL